MLKSRLLAYLSGYVDGWEQPEELTSGWSWSPEDSRFNWDQCHQMNEAYDTGVNHGQIVSGLVHRVRPQPWQKDFRP